jgi:tRNA threonylcarbamoyladenosine biosynthesis protein TsaE
MSLRARAASADDTRRLAAALAELARPGDLLLLAGELGAGKTTFTQGFGAALGVQERITSPTYVLASHYRGRLELHHIDVYRLDQMSELADVGLPELLDEGGVTLVEWGEAIIPSLPPDYLLVRIDYDDEVDQRIIGLEPVGPVWTGRERALQAALATWLVPC